MTAHACPHASVGLPAGKRGAIHNSSTQASTHLHAEWLLHRTQLLPATGRLQGQALRLLAAASHADGSLARPEVHAESGQRCGGVRRYLSAPVFRSSRVHRSCTGGGTSAGPSRSSASSCCSAKASSDSRAPPLSGSGCKQVDNYQACSLHRHSACLSRCSAQLAAPAPGALRSSALILLLSKGAAERRCASHIEGLLQAGKSASPTVRSRAALIDLSSEFAKGRLLLAGSA